MCRVTARKRKESKAKQRLRWGKNSERLYRTLEKLDEKEGKELDSMCDRMDDTYYLTMTAVLATTIHILTQLNLTQR